MSSEIRHGPDIEKRYCKDVLWLPSYFAAIYGGAPISILKEYIEQHNPALAF